MDGDVVGECPTGNGVFILLVLLTIPIVVDAEEGEPKNPTLPVVAAADGEIPTPLEDVFTPRVLGTVLLKILPP